MRAGPSACADSAEAVGKVQMNLSALQALDVCLYDEQTAVTVVGLVRVMEFYPKFVFSRQSKTPMDLYAWRMV